MKLRKVLLLLAFIISSISYAQSKITITANHADAQFFKVQGNSIVQPALGVGSIVLRLSKKEQNKIIIMKEGYQSLVQEYPRTRKWPKNIQVVLENRVVNLNTEPYDANIYLEGSFVGTKNFDLVVPVGGAVTVELRKKGYNTVSKTYYNQSGKDVPPLKDNLTVTDRVVSVQVSPPDADIYVDQVKVGKNSENVVIPAGKCVVVRAAKDGFIYEEKVFCNKESDSKPPLNHTFRLTDRLVKIVSTPEDAEIVLDGKIVGVGSYDLKVGKNDCVEILIRKAGFLTIKKNYCNSQDYQEPPNRDHLEMAEDEAYKSSVQTDLANVNFTIVVNPETPENEAWKLLSSIVTTEFDVLEVIDKETGYLRTAWQVRTFKGPYTIRTRVIVKLGDSNPLKYVMKISSEKSEKKGVTVKDDQDFEEWERILKKYQYIIEEAQSRL